MLPLCRKGRFRESMFDCLSQAITALPRRVASPMAEDASISGDDQGLRNRVAPVHQRYCRLAVGPAQAEAEFEVARVLLNSVVRGARIFSGQADELYAPRCELLAHLLVFRNFPAARAAPRRPEINDEDLAADVRGAEAAVVKRLELPLEQGLGHDCQFRRRD